MNCSQEEAERRAKRISGRWPGNTTYLYAIPNALGKWVDEWECCFGKARPSRGVRYGVFRSGAMVTKFPLCKGGAA